MYDDNNVFAKILRNEIPSTKIYEDDHLLCFEDISRLAPIHWLVIPKSKDCNFSDFIQNNSPEKISNFFSTINKIITENNLDKEGYRLVTNCHEKAGQSVFHFHVHILAGRKLTSNIA